MTRALSRQWQATWDLRQEQLSREINDQLSEILRQEIDREIMDDLREQQHREQGWYRVPGWSSEMPVIPRSREIATWLAVHCHGGYLQLYGRVVFESQEDAVLFQLTWA